MTLPVLFIVGCFAALLIWYMRRPNFTRLRLSAARFMPPLPPAQSSRTRWVPTAPMLHWRFYLRSAILGLLVAACFIFSTRAINEGRAVNLSIIVDTSHSMGVDGRRSANRVTEVLNALANHLSDLAKDAKVCFVLREVDVSVREIATPSIEALKSYKPTVRPEGADGTRLLNAAAMPSETCRPLQSVILTDRPAPAGLLASLEVPTIWLDLSKPSDNVGFVKLRGHAAPLDQHESPVVEISHYGKAPPQLSVEIKSVNGVKLVPVDVSLPSPWQLKIDVPDGPVRLTLIPGGAYGGDDRLIFTAQAAAPLKVKWKISDLLMPQIFSRDASLVDSTETPTLLVAPLSPGVESEIVGPTVFVYPGIDVSASDREKRRLGLFVEGSGLLAAVNFDLLEERMRPLDVTPLNFSPIVQDSQGDIVIAAHSNPRAVLIPGPYTTLDENGRRLWLTLLFNSLRWVLKDGDQVTPAEFVDSNGKIISNAVLESDTAAPERSVGAIEDIQPILHGKNEIPVWPWLVAAAALLLAIERMVGVGWSGSKS